MTTLIIIAAVIVLIALLRFGVSAEFDGVGPRVTAHIGFITVRILPSKPKKAKIKVKKPKKPRKQMKPEKEKKPGKLADFKSLVPAGLKALGRLRRRLLIKRLIVHYIAAGDDAYKTAMSFGTANAAFSVATPVLDRLFRIRRREFRLAADFEAAEPYIYVNAAISLAVWEAVYIAICLLPPLLSKDKSRKEYNNGKASDRRIDGSHNAEDPGNGGR